MQTGIADLPAYQNYKREVSRDKRFKAELGDFRSKADLANFIRSHSLPEQVDELQDGKLYAVDALVDMWDMFPETMAACLIGKTNIGWIEQLLKLVHEWALHGDGKHKLHHGRWVLVTFGTHCLKWDRDDKVASCA